MATKRKTTKKDLEAKIAQLEAKLSGISSKAGETAKKAPPPKPKPAEAPKPSAQKAAPPATIAQALENAWQNYPAGSNTHYYKEHTTGFTPGTNRYYGRLHAPVGTAPTTDWNLQKLKGTSPAPSNQYFATRQRLAYHPADRNFTGYGLVVEGAAAQAQQAPPPPQAEPQQQTTASSGGSSKQSDLEAYENDYMARLDQEEKENTELMNAAAELAAKRRGDSGGSSGKASSKKGALPKGF